MNKLLSVSILFVLLLVGCASEKENAIESMKPIGDGIYSVTVFSMEHPSGELQDQVNEIVGEASGVGEPRLVDYWGYKLLREDGAQGFDYVDIFEMEQFPEILVFDSSGLVFRTNVVAELKNFFHEKMD